MKNKEQDILVQDTHCERMVMGIILNFGSTYDSVGSLLDDDCFRDSKCLALWQAATAIRRRGASIDIITATAELARVGTSISSDEILDMSMMAASSVQLEMYALRLRELSQRRRLWKLGQKLINSGIAETDDIADVQQLATEELNGLFDIHKSTVTLTDALMTLSDIITQNISKGARITGTPTGFHRLDEKGGLHESDLVIVAGETSMGKTSFALAITLHAIESGHPVAMYSMEMTKEQLAARLVAMRSGVPSNMIMYSSDLQAEEVRLIDAAKGTMPGEMLFFDDDSTSNIDTILLSIRNMKIQRGIKGAVVDYLQILNVNSKTNQSREQQMGDAARRLKNLAKELGIWIIALSQLNRSGQDPVPTLARLRDSGQIAEAADVVLLLYRPEVYHRTFPYPFENIPTEEIEGKAMIDVAKGRNIGVFQFLVNFDANTTHFTDTDQGQEAPFGPVEEEAPF